jgi:hypothetical protein
MDSGKQPTSLSSDEGRFRLDSTTAKAIKNLPEELPVPFLGYTASVNQQPKINTPSENYSLR